MTNQIAKTVHIQTTSYIINIAVALERLLINNGFETKLLDFNGVHQEIAEKKEPDYYIFLFVWQLRKLPQKAKFFIYNLEQTNYYPNFPYLKSTSDDDIETKIVKAAFFEKAEKLLDYSKVNITKYPEELQSKAIYFPIPLRDKINCRFIIDNTSKDIHILFFGAMTPRRKNILDFLYTKTPLKIKVVRSSTGLYGDYLYDAIKKSYIVFNIHADTPSLLETARFHDCLRHSQTIIVSEDSEIDRETEELYKNIIYFVPTIKDDLSNIYDALTVIKSCLQSVSVRDKYLDIERNAIALNQNMLQEYDKLKPILYDYNYDVSIAYLTWKKYLELQKTLESHKDNGVFDIIPPENRIIFCQEVIERDAQQARHFKLNVLGNKYNVGILEAFIELVNNCKTKYFIFCENDMHMYNNNNYKFKNTIDDVCEILENDFYAQVKLSNYKDPGLLYAKGGEEWLKQDQSNYCYKAESLSWIPNPKTFYKNIDIISKHYDWFKFKSNDQQWSNQIYACNTKYLQTIVVPLLKHARDNKINVDLMYQGLEDILNFIKPIPNKNNYIDYLIMEHKKRTIYTGGGNFYHKIF
tara:strand:+ start:629 stop:2371 length:1743 start_codon:yes stop_codon:yes gene_type:complete